MIPPVAETTPGLRGLARDFLSEQNPTAEPQEYRQGRRRVDGQQREKRSKGEGALRRPHADERARSGADNVCGRESLEGDDRGERISHDF